MMSKKREYEEESQEEPGLAASPMMAHQGPSSCPSLTVTCGPFNFGSFLGRTASSGVGKKNLLYVSFYLYLFAVFVSMVFPDRKKSNLF